MLGDTGLGAILCGPLVLVLGKNHERRLQTPMVSFRLPAAVLWLPRPEKSSSLFMLLSSLQIYLTRLIYPLGRIWLQRT